MSFFGISFNFNASVEVIILFLSILMNGKFAGLEPVAITAYLKFIFSELTSFEISNVFLSIKEPRPLKTFILFFSIKKSIPFVV